MSWTILIAYSSVILTFATIDNLGPDDTIESS